MDINFEILKRGKWKEYDRETYFSVDGEIIDEKLFLERYPITKAEKTAILTIGLTLLDVAAFSYLRAYYAIDPEKTDEEALQEVEKIQYLQATENGPLERIASALEYIEMRMMEGEIL